MEARKLTIKQLRARSAKAKKRLDFDKVVSDLKASFMRDFTVEEACHVANITPATYYDWRSLSEEFEQEMKKAQSYAFRAAKRVIIDSVVDGGDVNNAKWLLERRQKKAYSTAQTLLGDEDNPLTIKVKQYGDDDTTTTEAGAGITELV